MFLSKITSHQNTHHKTTPFGPLHSCTQKRWRSKPLDTAQTRLESRTLDSKLDKLAKNQTTIKRILKLHELMRTRKHGPYVSVQIMSRWRNIVGLDYSGLRVGEFLHKYPHFFDVFTHPVRRNLCCRTTRRMRYLVEEEERVAAGESWVVECAKRVKRILMMCRNGRLKVHALRLIRRELGLPEDFRESILGRYSEDFRLLDLETVELVGRDEGLGVAEIEKWREREYREKWLSEFEVKFAFPINFPTGFRIEAGMRERMRTWQRLPYLKPYERKEEGVKVRSCGGVERFEKRAVGLIHELLSLTVEKMVEVERLAHFRKEFAMEVNIRELLLKHPGIFYISTKGNTRTLFLREAYSKGCLIEPNPIYLVRRKMLELVLLGCRNTKMFQTLENGHDSVIVKAHIENKTSGDWILPMLERLDSGIGSDDCGYTNGTLEESSDQGCIL